MFDLFNAVRCCTKRSQQICMSLLSSQERTAYGFICEDCWAMAQPNRNLITAHAEHRGRTLGTLRPNRHVRKKVRGQK